MKHSSVIIWISLTGCWHGEDEGTTSSVYWLKMSRGTLEEKTFLFVEFLSSFLNVWKITSTSNNIVSDFQPKTELISTSVTGSLLFLQAGCLCIFFFFLWSLSSCASQVWQKPNQFSGLLTTFNQCSIKTATLSAIPKPEVKYVFRRASRLLLLTDDQKGSSVRPYLHLTLLSN